MAAESGFRKFIPTDPVKLKEFQAQVAQIMGNYGHQVGNILLPTPGTPTNTSTEGGEEAQVQQ